MARRRVLTGAAWGQNQPGPESRCPPWNKAVAGHKHRQNTSGVTQPHGSMATSRCSPDGAAGIPAVFPESLQSYLHFRGIKNQT